jgi:hypothetical protein
MTICVLTRDTVPAEHLGDYVAQDWRATEHLRAGWSVAFGPVTEVVFLQAVGEGGAPPRLPAVPAGVALERRERQWLREVSPHRMPADLTTFELRTYDARTGQGEHFVELMLAALPIRQRYSPNCGVWTSLSGRQEQVLHMWGYRDLDERNRVRAALREDAEWSDYTATILPMLQVLNSTILARLPRC